MLQNQSDLTNQITKIRGPVGRSPQRNTHNRENGWGTAEPLEGSERKSLAMLEGSEGKPAAMLEKLEGKPAATLEEPEGKPAATSEEPEGKLAATSEKPEGKPAATSEEESDSQEKDPGGEDEAASGEGQESLDEGIERRGQVFLSGNAQDYRIYLLSIIGEIEGHECLPSNTKTTKYEHVLPKLACIEDDTEVDGVLLLLNTMGGDVESGLAIAEMVASLSKPTLSLVLGGSHSIGVPLAVSTDYSMIVPTGTMVIHPVRLSGTVIGAQPTYDYFQQMQDRITGFISDHCGASKERIEQLMISTQMMTKDLGTILVGREAVEEGLIDQVGGISDAFSKLYEMISRNQ